MKFKVIVQVSGKVTKTKSMVQYTEVPIDCAPKDVIRLSEQALVAWWTEQSGLAPESVRAVVIRPLIWGEE